MALISHSKIWSSSAIFVVEDDSQDGADHLDAHREPALVISPYARRGVVIHTRYDLLSVVRSMELIMGMKPLGLNDALATPMYNVFSPTPVNRAPVNNIPTEAQPAHPQHPRLPLRAGVESAPARVAGPGSPGGAGQHHLEIGLRSQQHSTTARAECRQRPVAASPSCPVATPAVRATGLVKRFEATIAVDHVDIEVHPGEVRGLLGPNGAGKTTLLRMLFGLVAPDAGSVVLCGRPLRVTDRLALAGVAGFVEDPSFYPYLSGRANLQLLAELDGGDARQRIDDALARVDLLGRAGDRVSVYSSGMRQRLGIATALLRDPRLLLLDEPTSGLDPAGAREVGALLRELSARGVAVLLSSHLIGEIESICDRFSVLARGRVVWSGSAAQLRAQAPTSAYVLSTSDDERALEIAELASRPARAPHADRRARDRTARAGARCIRRGARPGRRGRSPARARESARSSRCSSPSPTTPPGSRPSGDSRAAAP